MAETAQEVFNLHRMQKYEPVLPSVHGTYLLDIDKVGSWFVAAHMQGRFKIRGDMALAQKSHGW